MAPAAFRFGCLCPGRGLVSVDRTTPRWRSGCAPWGAPRSSSSECGFLANFATLYANGAPLVRHCGAGDRRFPRSRLPGRSGVLRAPRKTRRNWPEIPRMAANRRDEALRSSTGRFCLSQVGASPASQAILPGAASRVASSQRLGRPRRWWGQLPASREAMTAPLRTPWGQPVAVASPGGPFRVRPAGGWAHRAEMPPLVAWVAISFRRPEAGWRPDGTEPAGLPRQNQGPRPEAETSCSRPPGATRPPPRGRLLRSAARMAPGAWRLMSSGWLPSGAPSPAVGLLRVSGQFRRALR